MSETVVKVIETIRENRRRFEAFCSPLTEEGLGRPVPGSTWIVRDFAAHLGTLDQALAGVFGAPARGANPDSSVDARGHPWDVNDYNDAQVLARRDWPLGRVFAEAAENRSALIEVLRALTDEQIEASMRFAGDGKRATTDLPLKLFLLGWAQHDPIHVADMLKALPERAADPELRAWLDSPFVRGYQAAMNATLT